MGDRSGDKSGGASMLRKTVGQTQNNRYKQFKDVSRYSKGDRDGYAQFEYDGDGTEQIEFFKKYSNAYDLIDNMTPSERDSFEAWTRGEFMDGQSWEDWDTMDSRGYASLRELHKWTRDFDKILDKATLNRGIVVTRDTTAELLFGKGKTVGTLDEFKALEGKNIFAKGSMSTGAASTGLGIGSSSGKQVRLRISIPSGAKGAGMWIGDYRIHGWGAKQLEFMTNRDSWFKVGKTTFDKASGMYVVNIKWVGHDKHDYGTKKRKK